MSNCTFDPTTLKGKPIGMFHCPECGVMIMAGIEHPNVKYKVKCTHVDTGEIMTVSVHLSKHEALEKVKLGNTPMNPFDIHPWHYYLESSIATNR